MKRISPKITAIWLLAALLASGCAPSAADATVRGYSGEITLSASLEEDGRFALHIVSHMENEFIGGAALQTMVGEMNTAQTLCVDAVSGATVTSLAAQTAAEQALKKLRLDVEALKQNPRIIVTEYRTLGADVAVIGAGGAGLTAAIAAAEGGARVTVLEKLGVPGGSTLRSTGLIVATDSDLQRKYRENDTAESLAGFIYKYAESDLGSARQLLLAQHSGDNIRMLELLGVPFSQTLYQTTGSLARRGLMIAAEEESGGMLLMEPLLARAKELGVEILYSTRAYELIQTSTGRVTGVRARQANGTFLTITAGAVVLATGGYDHSETLSGELIGYTPELVLSGPGNTGDGIQMARAVGAGVFARGRLAATLEDLKTGLFEATGLIVDADGKRFGNEQGDPFALADRVAENGQANAWLIVGAAELRAAQRRGLDESAVVTAGSLAALAEKLGMPELPHTVDRYNRLCAFGADTDYDKQAQYLTAVTGPTYCAVELSFKSYGTMGGLMTDSSCRVMTAKDLPIAGLYAAGELINGNYYLRGFPGFGVPLAQVIETGRVAGLQAAAYAMPVVDADAGEPQ